jgi:polyhydroxyalkanoate synthesis regulator phasin
MAKKRLTGAQRRKIAKERDATLPPRVVTVETAAERQVVGNRLMTVTEWRREISKIYREMRSGKIRSEEGTRFVWVSEVGARLAKMQEELESIEALRRQLEEMQQLQGVLPTALLPHDSVNSSGDQP